MIKVLYVTTQCVNDASCTEPCCLLPQVFSFQWLETSEFDSTCVTLHTYMYDDHAFTHARGALLVLQLDCTINNFAAPLSTIARRSPDIPIGVIFLHTPATDTELAKRDQEARQMLAPYQPVFLGKISTTSGPVPYGLRAVYLELCRFVWSIEHPPTDSHKSTKKCIVQ
jgi:hypothetical protein